MKNQTQPLADEDEFDQYGRQKFKLPAPKATTQIQSIHPSTTKPTERKTLQAIGEEREFDPSTVIGKQITITKDSKAEEASAFYCELCKCSLKDSTAWYDHINGKKHNRLKGMSMLVERVDVDRVRAKLEALKSKSAITPVIGKR